MKKQISRLSGQKGFVLVYMAATLTTLLLFAGLAVDTGRAYVVKAQLTKAVDGAALAAARSLNSGVPKNEAVRVFKANFPAGYLGTTAVTDPAITPGFFAVNTNAASGVNTVTVTASATVPTTFMRLANFTDLTVTSSGEATRRMVDLSLVLDVSGSIGSQWGAVRDAARSFINAFDQNSDRLSLLTFSNGANVIDAMPSSRGFNKTGMIADVPNSLPGGSTNMVEGLYRGWDELRSVPTGTQSGLRIIVLFTDGASNGVPASWDVNPGTARSLRTWDFPKRLPDPDSQTWDQPHIDGLYDTATGSNSGFSYSITPSNWNNYAQGTDILPAAQAPSMPANMMSWHTHHRSPGIPTAFPLVTNALTVNGVAQGTKRPMRHLGLYNAGRYPAEVFNINNAARNLVEIIADAARNDAGGDYQVRIYTIGMGFLVQYMLGTVPEPSSDILMRMANDPASPDHNPAQLDGKFYYAQTAADVSAAFQGIQNQILRLSK
jgi:Flp pilus assembly protein TadG